MCIKPHTAHNTELADRPIVETMKIWKNYDDEGGSGGSCDEKTTQNEHSISLAFSTEIKHGLKDTF